jgi:HlyD family secretion protein
MEWARNNRWLIVGLPLAAVVLLAYILTRRADIPVRAETVRRETIVNVISTNGRLEPVEIFQAHAVAPILVKKVLVKEGDAVKAGQLLVLLDDAEAKARAARAQTQLRAAEAEIAGIKRGGSQDEALTTQSNLAKARTERDAAERSLAALRKLRANGSASDGEVQEAENRLKRAQSDVTLWEQRASGRFSNPEIARIQSQAEQARAELEAAQEVLRQTHIVSDRNGTVYSLPVKVGQILNVGDLITQVADLRKMQARVFIDEPDIAKVATGQKVEMTWDAVPDRRWVGTVSRVPSAVVLRGTRNVGEVLCSVDNSDQKLIPNINVNVIITSARQDGALTVSREAVLQADGKRFVYQVRKERLARTEVQTGISNLTRIQVLSGVKEGDVVALGSVGSQPLAENASVKIVELLGK